MKVTTRKHKRHEIRRFILNTEEREIEISLQLQLK